MARSNGGLLPSRLLTQLIFTTQLYTKPFHRHVLLTSAFETQGKHLIIHFNTVLSTNTSQVTTPQPQSPMNQQQIRPTSTYQSQDTLQPRNQMEAMPPHHSPRDQAAFASRPQSSNPAMVHPVFFAEAWRKAPFPVPSSAGFSPVATGYVFGGSVASRKEPLTKL